MMLSSVFFFHWVQTNPLFAVTFWWKKTNKPQLEVMVLMSSSYRFCVLLSCWPSINNSARQRIWSHPHPHPRTTVCISLLGPVVFLSRCVYLCWAVLPDKHIILPCWYPHPALWLEAGGGCVMDVFKSWPQNHAIRIHAPRKFTPWVISILQQT